MGLMLAEPGFHTRCYVEWEEYPRRALIAGQRAGYLGAGPIWDDLTTFDARPFRGAFDTVLAGYPCQPFSQAGQRKGEDDERHLWPDVARIVRECGPEWVFLENVAGHVTLGGETVLRELHQMGYTPAVGLFSAEEVGATHERLRWFCVAHRDADADAGRLDSGRTERSEAKSQSKSAKWERIRPGVRSGSGHVAHRAGVRERESDDAQRADAWTDARRGIGRSGRGLHGELAHANGRDACPEREQCGGEQRLHPEGGCAGSPLGHPEIIGRGEGRAEPEFRGGRDTPSGADRTMADASGAELEGQFGRQRDAGGRQEPDRHPALSGRAGLFPPGPADMGRWAGVIADAPYLAPAASFGDLASYASQVAAMAQAGLVAEAEIEPVLRGMADGLALRARALQLLGNGVVPLVAAYAWRTLSTAHGLRPVDLGATADKGTRISTDSDLRAAE